MAAKSTLGVETYAAPRKHGSFRLQAGHVTTIRDFLTSEESEAGIRTRYLVDLRASVDVVRGGSRCRVCLGRRTEKVYCDECCGTGRKLISAEPGLLSRSTPSESGGVFLFDAERWCDSNLEANELGDGVNRVVDSERRRRLRRCRATFAVLRSDPARTFHAGVLGVTYGGLDPTSQREHMYQKLWGDLAPLARFTDAVEDRRHAMVAEAVAQWRAARLAEGVAKRCTEEHHAVVRSLVFEIHDVPAYARHVDRELTSGDALREALAPLATVPDESPSARKARTEAHKDARTMFISDVNVQADKMLARASEAYREAWGALS